MMRLRAVSLAWAPLAGTLLVVGCNDEPQRGPTAPSDEPAPQPTGDEEPRGTRRGPGEPVGPRVEEPVANACRADTPLTLMTATGRVASVAIALSSGRGLIVAPDGSATLRALPVDGEGRGRAGEVRIGIPSAQGLFGLRAVGDRFIALVHAPCVGVHRAPHCLQAFRVDADGRATEDADGRAVSLLEEPIHTARVAAAEDSVIVARSHRTAEPAVDRFVVSADGSLSHRRHPLGTGLRLREQHVEILGLAAHGRRWAAIWRYGAPEDARSEVMLSFADGRQRPVEALHHALVVESFAWDRATLPVVVGFEFSRPHWIRLGMDGEPVEAALEIAAGDRVPAPFETRRRAAVEDDGTTVTLRISDGAGDPVGRPVTVLRRTSGGGRSVADVARSRDGFVVAFANREGLGWAVSSVRVRCPPPPPPL